MSKETDARIVIDRLLREAGWDIENPAMVSTEEAAADGRADYLLKNSRTQPLSLLEAKRFSSDPYGAKGQSKAYASSLGAPFVILSNAREHYLWEYDTGDARPILGFPSQPDLERRANLRFHRQGDLATSLRAIPVPARFRFKGDEVEARPYQLDCIQAADAALLAARRRMLFEMATGTGKTLTIAMPMKRWFQAAVMSRVLLRPTTSAIKYAQMRGRGSRLCPRIGKTDFLIYDFVGNYERFNDPAERYDRPKQKNRRPPGPGPLPPPPPPRTFTVIAEGSLADEIRKRQLIHVGPEGMAIDRKTYQDRWRERIVEMGQSDPVVRRVLAGQDISEAEWQELARRLNSPEFYFEEGSLRRAFEQPVGSLTDFIRAALGLYHFPSREQRIERAFNTWIAEHSESINPDQARLLRLLRNVVMAAATEYEIPDLKPDVFNQPAFRRLGGLRKIEGIFGKQRLTDILDELRQLLKAA